MLGELFSDLVNPDRILQNLNTICQLHGNDRDYMLLAACESEASQNERILGPKRAIL